MGAVLQGSACTRHAGGATCASHLHWRQPSTSKALQITHTWILCLFPCRNNLAAAPDLRVHQGGAEEMQKIGKQRDIEG